jgi:hypothetical protein
VWKEHVGTDSIILPFDIGELRNCLRFDVKNIFKK